MAILMFYLATLSLVAACTRESAPDAGATSGTLVEQSLDLLDSEISNRLRAMPWVTDGTDESGAFVGATMTLERSGEYPGWAQRQADIVAVLDTLEEAAWYKPDLDASKKLLLTSLFEIYTLGHRTRPDGVEYGPVYEWRPAYPWLQLIKDVIRLDLHVEHHSASGAPVQLIAWGDATESVQEALGYASEHLGGIEQFAGKHGAKYILVVVDSGLRDGYCGRAYPLSAIIVINPTAACSLEITVAHEMTHLVLPVGSTATWFDEGMAALLSYRLTDQDFSGREASVRSHLEDEAFFMLDRFHYPENHRFSADDQSRESSAGFLFAYELVQIIGYDALSTAVQGLPDYFFGQDAINAIFDATPEEHRGEVQSLIAKWCRQAEMNWFTRERFQSPTCEPS